MSDAWKIASQTERGYLLHDEYGRPMAEVFDPETAIRVVRAMNAALAAQPAEPPSEVRTATETDQLRALIQRVVGQCDNDDCMFCRRDRATLAATDRAEGT